MPDSCKINLSMYSALVYHGEEKIHEMNLNVSLEANRELNRELVGETNP